jgi:hypothetical protein
VVTPPATVYQTFEAEAVAVPMASLSPVAQEDPPPGAPGASPAAHAAGPTTASPSTPTTATRHPYRTQRMPHAR